MLVYTNPANPMGLVYSKEEMEIVYQFACEYDLHIVYSTVYTMISSLLMKFMLVPSIPTLYVLLIHSLSIEGKCVLSFRSIH